MNKAVKTTILFAIAAAFVASPMASAHSGTSKVLSLTTFANQMSTGGPTVFGGQDGPDVIRSLAGPQQDNAAEDDDDSYDMKFRCADITQNTGTMSVGAYGCPLYVPDPEDIMSQPVLMVDPNDVNLIAFNAMHGGVGLPRFAHDPPSSTARYNILHQPHTTFRSEDGGISWDDNRYYAPEALRGDGDDPSARDLYGMDNAAAIDAAGKLYLASLYAYRDGPNGEPWHYKGAFWKGVKINRPPQYECCLQIPGEDQGWPGQNAIISNISLIFVPHTNAMVFTSLVKLHPDDKSNIRGHKSYIDVWYTVVGGNGGWRHMRQDQLIGECRGATNPIQFRGIIYIGCLPGEKYGYDPRNATADHLQMHAIDTANWVSWYVAPTPMMDGHFNLVTEWDSYMVLIQSGLRGNRPFVDVSYGEYGKGWSDLNSFGDAIDKQIGLTSEDPDAEERVRQQTSFVKVTGAAFKPESGELHMIYMERYQLDPAKEGNARVPTYQKWLASVHHQASLSNVVPLKVGDPDHRKNSPYALAYTGLTEDVYIDNHDSIALWKNPKTDKYREFIAYGDYGYVRFGEIIESDPLIFVPYPPTEVVIIAVAEPASQASLTSAAAGVIFGFMVLRLLTAKKKATAKVPVGAEK